MVASHLEEVDRKIADLILLRDELRRMMNCCGQVVADCQIIGSLTAAATPQAPSPDAS